MDYDECWKSFKNMMRYFRERGVGHIDPVVIITIMEFIEREQENLELGKEWLGGKTREH